MKILVITQDYPDSKRNAYAFVQQLVNQFAMMGHSCCVISPYSIVSNHGIYPFREIRNFGKGTIEILRPNHVSLSNIELLGFSPTNYFRKLALNRALKRLPFRPDIIYAHFWRSGREIYPYAQKHKIPLFVATGESVIPQNDISPQFVEFYNYVRGVICVSSKNKEESVTNGLATEDKCIVLPNGINPKLFYKKDRMDCRRRLGIAQEAFVVAFCGAFCRRKGVGKLSKAIDRITENNVYSLFIGRPFGENPSCRNILFQGTVQHDNLADYLNAADIFVLPTLHEGCCNAIIEALACGLPVVSSNLPFNWDVLNDSNSIMVDPSDTTAIAKAIVELRDNKEKRGLLSDGALSTAKGLTIEERAEKILGFINKKLSN